MSIAVAFDYKIVNYKQDACYNAFFTYESPDPKQYIREVNANIASLTQFFTKDIKPRRNDFILVNDISEYEASEETLWGVSYSIFNVTKPIALPEDTFAAALAIMENMIPMITNKAFTSRIHIPRSRPIRTAPLEIDPRYTLGETLVDKEGERFTYAGVLDSLRPKKTNKEKEINYFDMTTTVGVLNKDYIKETDIAEFIANTEILFRAYVPQFEEVVNGNIWAAYRKEKRHQRGCGVTQEQASDRLAISVLFPLPYFN